jgi:hypothetical protein
MIYYFLLVFIVLILGFLFSLQTHLIVKNELSLKYNKWKRLNSLVSTSQKTKISIVIISFKLIFQAIWISLLQRVNKTIKKLNKNKYELTYIIEGKMYKLVVNVTRGPSPVLQIINDTNDDVTSQIMPYLGPSYNWHNTPFTPEFFGLESLTFEVADGTEYSVQNKKFIKSFNK